MRLQQELDIIGTALIKADELNILEQVQEIFRPFILQDESLDLNTICELESLLGFKIINVCPSDKEIRKEKLMRLKISSGEFIPKTVYLHINDETGLVYIKDE